MLLKRYSAKYEHITPAFHPNGKRNGRFSQPRPIPKRKKKRKRQGNMIGGTPPRTFIQYSILSSKAVIVFVKIASPAISIAIAVANVCKENQMRASTNP